MKVGDMVWFGWHPENEINEVDARLRQFEIVELSKTHFTDPRYSSNPNVWEIYNESLGRCLAPEYLLIKIPPQEIQDKEEHEDKTKNKRSTEAV